MIEKHKKLPCSDKGFGVELEFNTSWEDLSYVSKSFKTKFLNFTNNRFCCLKTDGSCGTEINLGIYPFSMGGIAHFINHIGLTYEDFFANMNDLSKSSYRPYNRINLLNSKCGMHVHLSYSLFNDQTIERFLKYFYQYEKDIFKYCVHESRSKTYYVRAINSVPEYRESMATDKTVNKDHFLSGAYHYDAINYNERHDTIELRYMGMTSNIRSVKNWLLIILFLFKESQKNIKEFASLQEHLKSYPKKGLNLLGDWLTLFDTNKFAYQFKEERRR